MTLPSRHDPSKGRACGALAGHAVRGRNVLVVGKNSYVGEFLCRHFSAQGASVSAVGSSDCNLLEAEAVHELFKSFGRKPFTIL